MIPDEAKGLVSVRSTVSFDETIECLLIALERRGMTIHARVDYAKEAIDVGVRLRPTQLFIFGYREVEASLILRDQLLGVDLPQKILVWEDERGAVWISYNDPKWVGQRHGVPAGTCALLEAVAASLAGIAADARAKIDRTMK